MNLMRAKKQDIPGINNILLKNGFPRLNPNYINKNDIGIVAKPNKTEVAGFIWVGLIANNTIGTIEVFVVDPAYSGKGVGSKLGKHMVKIAHKKKVRQLVGAIPDTEAGVRSLSNALKIKMKPYPYMFAVVDGNTEEMLKEMNNG